MSDLERLYNNLVLYRDWLARNGEPHAYPRIMLFSDGSGRVLKNNWDEGANFSHEDVFHFETIKDGADQLQQLARGCQ